MIEELALRTSSRSEFVDITAQVQEIVSRMGAKEGICLIGSLHTTAGITVNENADPTVPADIIAHLDRMIPWQGPFKHSEGNSAAHIKTSLVGSSVTLPLRGSQLILGTWQGIFFCEFDGPRHRKVLVEVIPGQ